MKKSFCLLILFLILIALPLIGLSEPLVEYNEPEPEPETGLQLRYPALREIGIDLYLGMRLGYLFKYLYYFLITISGVVLFFSLVLAGFKWLTSAGNPGKLGAAKKAILFSFTGIIILLSSWLILRTIDPQLVIMPLDTPRVRGVEEFPRPDPVRPEPLYDGIVLILDNHPNPRFRRIEIPGGNLNIADTRRFRGNLAKLGPGGVPLLNKIEFRNPSICFEDVCIPKRYYGIICFSGTHFQGVAQAFLSVRGQENTIVKNICAAKAPCLPCRSLFSFRQPAIPVYSLIDHITFYQSPFEPPRIPPGVEDAGQVIDGACIRIDAGGINPEGCAGLRYLEKLRRPKENHDIQTGKLGIKNLGVLGWFPLSMEIKASVPRRYLLLLFTEKNFKGRVYKLWERVPDFANPYDRRLNWLHWRDLLIERIERGETIIPIPIDEIPAIPPEPRSIQIFPIEPF